MKKGRKGEWEKGRRGDFGGERGVILSLSPILPFSLSFTCRVQDCGGFDVHRRGRVFEVVREIVLAPGDEVFCVQGRLARGALERDVVYSAIEGAEVVAMLKL